MITKIPEGQICQAFDSIMFLPEKTAHILEGNGNANTSCVAPAFVYIEGTHGKKFLCDFHYYQEVNMTRDCAYKVRADSWQNIQEYIIDERERIKETFAKNVSTNITLGKKCHVGSGSNLACVADAFIFVSDKRDRFSEYGDFYCNYHFRKNYYRFYSNGIIYEDVYNIIDERSRMTITIADEARKVIGV